MKKHKLFKSLRAQLPISFAGIALLATTLIGLVMYITNWNYYSGLEQEYLDSNVHGTANNLSRIAENSDIILGDSLKDNQEVFQNQANITAFLIQARVRILDTEGNVVADSGSPSQSWNITVPQPQNNRQSPPPQDQVPTDAAENLTAEPTQESNTNQSTFSLEPSENKPPQNANDGPPDYSFEANPNMFGYLLAQDAVTENDKRSSAVVEAPFHDQNDQILGYVELSESPEYGQQIIKDMIRGWGIASIIGVIVSTAFGYLVSRNLTRPLVNLESVASEMKDGNYEIRSPIYKPDELASLSDTFNKMAAHIQHNIETLRHFVSDAAHEIRTPLTSLRADLNLAISERSMEKATPMIQRSLEQVDRLDRLSKNLLDLSKLESTNEKPDFKQLNLNDLLQEASEIHASAAEQAEIEFDVQIPKKVVFVMGDSQQLQLAVSNLLNNAVKFTPPGGKAFLRMEIKTDSVTILVGDNGIGIPAEERKRLFNRFHRGKNTQNYPGSGLGLAIAKAIVEKHNGSIGIMPDKNKTVFFIKLPQIIESARKKSRCPRRQARQA